MTLFIGSYTKNAAAGIAVTQFDSETGELAPPKIAIASPDPSFLALHPDGRVLFAANASGAVGDGNDGGVTAFSIGPDDELTLIGASALPGGPCHVAVDATGQLIVAATYSAGTMAAYTMPDHSEAALKQVAFSQQEGKGQHPRRQDKAHAHQAVFSPDNQFLFIVDLGADKLFAYRVEEGGKTVGASPTFAVPLPAGSGPRHMAFTPDGKYLYVVGELDNTVTGFRYDAAAGKCRMQQCISTLPVDYEGTSYLAEIAVHPNGRFLYISNRGHDSIARFEIQDGGLLKSLGYTATGGANPRHFTFDPTGAWLLVANADDAAVVVFKVDDQSGDLEMKNQRDGFDGEPVCLVFATGGSSDA